MCGSWPTVIQPSGHAALPFRQADLDAKAGAIEIVRYFPMREQVWLDRLADHKHSEVAFVCGNWHIEGFTELLKKNEIPSRVVDRGIGLDNEGRDSLEIAVAYLEKHPELRKL